MDGGFGEEWAINLGLFMLPTPPTLLLLLMLLLLMPALTPSVSLDTDRPRFRPASELDELEYDRPALDPFRGNIRPPPEPAPSFRWCGGCFVVDDPVTDADADTDADKDEALEVATATKPDAAGIVVDEAPSVPSANEDDKGCLRHCKSAKKSLGREMMAVMAGISLGAGHALDSLA